jgi:transposase
LNSLVLLGNVNPAAGIKASSHRGWLIERCRGAGFTPRGLVAELAERGLTVDYRTIWRFVHAEGLSFKENRAGAE